MQSETTTICFSEEHPVFSGHFPGRPIVPGVLLLDAALHAATQAMTRAAMPPSVTLRCQITSAKFLSPVLPGETLTIACSATPAGQTRFDISAADRQVASGTFAFERLP